MFLKQLLRLISAASKHQLEIRATENRLIRSNRLYTTRLFLAVRVALIRYGCSQKARAEIQPKRERDTRLTISRVSLEKWDFWDDGEWLTSKTGACSTRFTLMPDPFVWFSSAPRRHSPCEWTNSSLRPPSTSVANTMAMTVQTRPVLHSVSMVTTVIAIVTDFSALSQHFFCPLGCPVAYRWDGSALCRAMAAGGSLAGGSRSSRCSVPISTERPILDGSSQTYA